MKQKVINVTYRKDSETFPDWMKYEVTLLNEDGTQQTIPAYGMDLQDALSRVVHDKKVARIQKRTARIPDLVWVALWFGYILGWLELTYLISPDDQFNGLFFAIGMAMITAVTLRVSAWFTFKNREK